MGLARFASSGPGRLAVMNVACHSAVYQNDTDECPAINSCPQGQISLGYAVG